MPIYDYYCDPCGRTEEITSSIEDRDGQWCHECGGKLRRLLAAPMGKMAGQVARGGGPDRFTADMLGIPLKDLPKGLKTDG